MHPPQTNTFSCLRFLGIFRVPRSQSKGSSTQVQRSGTAGTPHRGKKHPRWVGRGLSRKCALPCRSTAPEIPSHLASESWEVLPGAQKRSQIMWLRLLEEPVPEVVPEVAVQRTRRPRKPGNCSHFARWLRPQVARAVRRKRRRRFRLPVGLGSWGLVGCQASRLPAWVLGNSDSNQPPWLEPWNRGSLPDPAENWHCLLGWGWGGRGSLEGRVTRSFSFRRGDWSCGRKGFIMADVS